MSLLKDWKKIKSLKLKNKNSEESLLFLVSCLKFHKKKMMKKQKKKVTGIRFSSPDLKPVFGSFKKPREYCAYMKYDKE